jgi:hypothetical protein
VGVLFIIGTVAGSLGVVFAQPILNAQDSLISVSANENQVKIGALFALIMAVAVAGIPVTAYPVLRKHNETLALGYVVFRGGLEAVTHIAVVINWLLRLPLSQVYVQTGAPDASNLQALGALLLEAEEISSSIGTIVFCLGTLMFYYVLYQSKLIPRWLSGWGLIAVILYLSEGLLSMFALISSLSMIGVVLDLPLALQEMVLAVWLIVKGFNPSAIASEPAKIDINEEIENAQSRFDHPLNLERHQFPPRCFDLDQCRCFQRRFSAAGDGV